MVVILVRRTIQEMPVTDATGRVFNALRAEVIR